jgi:hypothetical protein
MYQKSICSPSHLHLCISISIDEGDYENHPSSANVTRSPPGAKPTEKTSQQAHSSPHRGAGGGEDRETGSASDIKQEGDKDAKKKKKTQISASEYEGITQFLALRLKAAVSNVT